MGGLIGAGISYFMGGGMNTGAPAHVGAGGTTAFHMAGGGWADPYSVHNVNELGPELLSVGGRDYLMMGSQGGRVTPNNQIKSGSAAQDITVTINNTGSDKKVQSATPRFDAHGMVVDIVLSDLDSNGPIKQALGQGAL